jgi:hypothetical protein
VFPAKERKSRPAAISPNPRAEARLDAQVVEAPGNELDIKPAK